MITITGEPLKWLLIALIMGIFAFIMVYLFINMDDESVVLKGIIAMFLLVILCGIVEGAQPSVFY